MGAPRPCRILSRSQCGYLVFLCSLVPNGPRTRAWGVGDPWIFSTNDCASLFHISAAKQIARQTIIQVFLQVVWGRMRAVKTGWWRTLVLSRPWRDCRTSQHSTWHSAGWVPKLVLFWNVSARFWPSDSFRRLFPAGGSQPVVAGAKGRAADEAWGCQFGQRHPDAYIPQSVNGGLQPETHCLAWREPPLDNSSVSPDPLSSTDTRSVSAIVSTQRPQGQRGTKISESFKLNSSRKSGE